MKGRVAAELLNEYRQGNLNLEYIEAFTASDDAERQLACFRELSGVNIDSQVVRN